MAQIRVISPQMTNHEIVTVTPITCKGSRRIV
jgi:hypothetical protein